MDIDKKDIKEYVFISFLIYFIFIYIQLHFSIFSSHEYNLILVND